AAAGVEALAAAGCRVLGVAFGDETALHFAGLVALQDPPREDSAALVASLRELGVRVVMVTGDGQATARTVAKAVGIGERACPASMLAENATLSIKECDVFAQVFPEDKFHLVEALQGSGHVTGMTGDGVNDAPALKQAEVGIAVANATDVAKAAASLVLTNPGLSDVVAAVETSRRIYQRMLTYTLNKIIKTLEIAIFMSVGVMLTGVFVITPLLIVLLLFTNDFVTMSIATDRVEFSRKPERWRIPTLMQTAAPLAALILVLSFSVFFAGRDLLHLPLAQLQTLIFVMLVFTGLGNVYLVRERRHFWQSRPSRWLMFATLLDIAVVSAMASRGILMTAISPALIAGLLAVATVYLVALDFLKIFIFRRSGLV
ncbi:MAG: HAD-IC family P-type ATPase, partial [Sulfuricellaceae bacterium]|nr:HAD-IC family P-type ATPase [Sulfuricellaceae bacterium]